MENENLRNIENLLAAKASTQPLYEFPVDQLPLGLRDSLSGVAAEARVPALFSALPIAATYADRLKAKYCDGSDTPMALMSIIIGEQASGKGVCRRIENIWAKKMDKDDEKPREDEAWYQQHKGKKGVVDPKPCIPHWRYYLEVGIDASSALCRWPYHVYVQRGARFDEERMEGVRRLLP